MDTTSVAEAKPTRRLLAELEERYRHELVSEEERLELRERILRLKKAARS